MSVKNSRSITPRNGGFFEGLGVQVKLIWRLMGDRRVNPFIKLLPIGSLVYLVFPDIAIGPIDDAMVLWLGTYLFVELCPDAVVEEHRRAIQQRITGTSKDTPDVEVIDGEYWEVPSDSPDSTHDE